MSAPAPILSFSITPKKQAGFLHFLRQQITFKPQLVGDVGLEGKTAIVMGSNCGVGLETSRQLLDPGLTKLILAVRNKDKGRAAAANLAAGREPPLPEGTIEVWKLDLDLYDSAVAFAERARSSLDRLDIAILNAGLCPAGRVNYLSTALLAILPLPAAAKSGQPIRITLTSSEVAAFAKFKARKDYDDAPILKAVLRRVGSSCPIPPWRALLLITNHWLSMAPIIYTEEWKKVSEQLWKETMEELSFAKPEDMLSSLPCAVNAPRIRHVAYDLVDLWLLKARLARGRRFDLARDIGEFSFDAILSAAMGLGLRGGDVRRQLNHTQPPPPPPPREKWDDADPAEFRPWRWLRESSSSDGRLVYDAGPGPELAFSSGNRGCWGRRLGELELRVVLALLVWSFEFALSDTRSGTRTNRSPRRPRNGMEEEKSRITPKIIAYTFPVLVRYQAGTKGLFCVDLGRKATDRRNEVSNQGDDITRLNNAQGD
ncbi:hypothetical protein B0T24DRAFT_667278 [Lasiosphaeria ovina]|uniref:Uncharacterized protein n=1 Tax=Lasiosphaeria ovina TaxID=92902 RepID=A0AAE0KCI2_9PEZI|nr:hypothetical protein B0T24DRAFT_667278 [Lasiosphaeria ovina]